MTRLAITAIVVTSATLLSAPAGAQSPQPLQPPPPAAGPPSSLPSVGETLALAGAPGWAPKLEWMYDVPSFKDATGKVVLHWFCAPKVDTCIEDLARVVTLKENARVYVIAYIGGKQADAKKLDPIRGSEGVGRGTVAFGRRAVALMKELRLTGQASIVVGIDNKVAFATTGASPADLDARDAKVTALSRSIKDYTASSDGPKLVKAGDRFGISMTIKLAPWLAYSRRTPAELRLTAPRDIKCDHTTLRGDQLKITQTTMVAQLSCSGPRGVYELRGTITFGYDNPVGGGSGLGTEGATWKFEIKP